MITSHSLLTLLSALSLAACSSGGASNGSADAAAGTSGQASSVGIAGASASAGTTNASGGSASSNGGGSSSSAGASSLGGAGSTSSFGGNGGSANHAGGSGGLSAGGASHTGGGAANGGGGSGGPGGAGGASSTGGAAAGGLPAKVVAGYYPNWTDSPVRIKDVSPNYNLIYLFAATPVGGAPGTTGAITWTPPGNGRGAATNFNADIQTARTSQGRKIILSVGGAGNGMSFPNRAKSQTFVDSVVSWYTQFGGFDGLDWNTFEGNRAPDTNEMIWISLELKKRYPGFVISAPPAPWNSVDKAFCAAMAQAGALDYAAPQYYDGPDLATQSYMVSNVAQWVTLLGASKVVVGFGIWDQPNYMSITDAVSTWKALEKATPTLRGAFDWQIHTDEAQGWPFATQLAPLVLQ